MAESNLPWGTGIGVNPQIRSEFTDIILSYLVTCWVILRIGESNYNTICQCLVILNKEDLCPFTSG